MTTKNETGNWGQLSHGMTYDYDAGLITGDLRIGHLAHALAGINRYLAWPAVYWPVASHACLVAQIVASQADYDASTILGALHHDDHEALIGDVLQPFQRAMSPQMQWELKHHATKAQNAITRKLGIWTLVPDAADTARAAVIKAADIAALEAERRWLFHVRMEWATEKIVNPKMLDAAERILAGDFSRTIGGKAAADRFVDHHNALVAQLERA